MEWDWQNKRVAFSHRSGIQSSLKWRSRSTSDAFPFLSMLQVKFNTFATKANHSKPSQYSKFTFKMYTRTETYLLWKLIKASLFTYFETLGGLEYNVSRGLGSCVLGWRGGFGGNDLEWSCHLEIHVQRSFRGVAQHKSMNQRCLSTKLLIINLVTKEPYHIRKFWK